jgi:hypothetical protein
MLSERIDYKFVAPGTQEFSELTEFAKDFDHEIVTHPCISVCAHTKNGKLVGYSDHIYLPVAYPAFHPKYTSPRDVVRVMNDYKTHVQLTKGIGYVGVPLEHEREGAFTNAIMEKLTLTRMNREIYCIE